MESDTSEVNVALRDKPVAVRLTRDLIARIDRHLYRMRRENPALNLTQADSIRVLLTQALDAAEGKAPKKSR